jgi:hypothetical protein
MDISKDLVDHYFQGAKNGRGVLNLIDDQQAGLITEEGFGVLLHLGGKRNQTTRSGFDPPLGSGEPVLRPGIYLVARPVWDESIHDESERKLL